MSFYDWLFDPGPQHGYLGLASLTLRVGAGALLGRFHGWHKLAEGIAWRAGRLESWPFVAEIRSAGFPAPVTSAWLATAVQFLGGICLVFGVLTRPVAALIFVTLLGALLTDLRLRKDLQLVLVYLLLLFGVLCNGPGPWSVDHVLLR